MLAPPWLLAIGLVIGLLVLIPARRLQAAGLSSGAIGLYALLLWALAMLVAIRPGATRLLIPLLLVAALAPFLASPDTIRRVLRRPPATPGPPIRPPMKNVTPPDERPDERPDVRPDERPDERPDVRPEP